MESKPLCGYVPSTIADLMFTTLGLVDLFKKIKLLKEKKGKK
jgi:hypothetical protein